MVRKLIIIVLAALIAAVVVCLAGCGNMAKDKVEKSVAESLPTMIGPAKSYNVDAYGSTLRMMKGKLEGLDITGQDVQLKSGVTLSRLFVQVRDIRFDPNTREVHSVGSTAYSATLSEAELNRYLKKRYPNVPDLKLELRKDAVRITTRPGVSVLRTTVQADSGLLIQEERRLILDLKSLKVGPVGAPEFVRNYIESEIGTIFDAKDLGFDATIKSVSVQPNGLVLNGTLDLMELLKKQAKSV